MVIGLMAYSDRTSVGPGPLPGPIEFTLGPAYNEQFDAQQECIPVGCVPPACCPHLPGLGEVGCKWSWGMYLVQDGGCTWSGGEGVYLVWGVCTWSQGCTWSWGVYLVQGRLGPGGGGTCPGTPPLVNRMTDAKIWPCPKLRLRAVKMCS